MKPRKDSKMKENQTINRRAFITAGMIAGVSIAIPNTLSAMMGHFSKPVKIGIITDLHHDLVPDGMERLTAFLNYTQKLKPDAILQMGDFAFPAIQNKLVVDRFNGAHDTRMHVIGNHDTDAGHTKQECLEMWGMPAAYYSKVVNGICFIILDGNEIGSPGHKGGYPSYIGEKQVEWLKGTLEEQKVPVVIVSHQPLAGVLAVDNAAEIQEILSHFSAKILLSINGHTHVDLLVEKNGLNYLHINSASYFWVGDKYRNKNYPEAVQKEHPILEQTCPYKTPLFATLIIDPINKRVSIEGKNSSWMGKSPEEMGYQEMKPLIAGQEIAPRISSRSVLP